MKVAIVGSRHAAATDIAFLYEKLPPNCTGIISGGAMGIDSLAEKMAAAYHIPFTKIQPDYARYGKKAPLVRNRKIVEKADLVLAFWDFHSRGTAHTIVHCLQIRRPVRVFRLDNHR